MTEKPNDLRSLRDDQRGAIMVVGVFMAIVMGAGIFYIIGTGEAIIYRQRVQDGADAVAFTAAAIHAKGMNIIVLLNLIMAALVTVLVAMKVIDLLNNIATPLATGICAASLGTAFLACAYAPVGGWLMGVLRTAIPTYENVFMKPALFALSTAQTGIAIGTPWVALVKSRGVGDKYKPLADNSFIVSPSMLPYVPPGKLGLPVKYGDYKDLCKKAGENIGEVFGFLPNFVAQGVKAFGGMVTSAFSGYFCGDLVGGGFNQAADLLPTAEELLDKIKQQCNETAKSQGDEFDKQKCIDDAEKQANDSLKQSKENTTSSPVFTGNAQKAASFGGKVFDYISHKELIDGAKLGGGHFQVYGITIGKEEWPRSMDKGMAIATKGGVKPPLTSWGKYRVSQSEFFWDRSGKIDNDDTMWERMWTARLRRLAPKLPELGAGFASWGIMDKLGVGKALEKVLVDNDDSPLGFLFGKVAKDKLGSVLGDLVKGLGGLGDKWVNSKISQFLQTPEMIH